MKKKIKTYKDLPFEEGKVYRTKFQTGERFLIKEIIKNKDKIIGFKGIYESTPQLGVCPLNSDRLVAERIEGEDLEVCNKCNEPI